jgi:tetratricopeptide (TPR) repeat protein
MNQNAKDKQILDSWKEIAQHLNRTVRTCQKWEQTYDLPVHRFDGTPKARVFAYREELDHWLEEILHEREATQKSTLSSFLRKRNTLFISALVLIVLIVSAVIILRIIPGKEAVQLPPLKPTLAILPFENISRDVSLEDWRAGLSELLITDLNQSRFINVLSRDKIYSILKKLDLLEAKKYTTEDLIKVANEGRADYTVSGSFIKAGEIIAVTLLLQKPHTGDSIGSKMVECQGEEEILARVDELSESIKLDLNLSQNQISNDIDEKVGQITTNSPQAYKYYLEGIKYHIIGDYRLSIEFMKKAVALDPEFAMAYRAMSSTYVNMGYTSERIKCTQKALELSDRVSLRERLHILGIAAETRDERIEAYQRLLEIYPDDPVANNNLGVYYLYYEKWDKAEERFMVGVRNKSDNRLAYSGLAEIYYAKGSYNEARKVIMFYLNNVTDNWRSHRELAHLLVCQGEFPQALEELEKSISLNSNMVGSQRLKGDIYHLMGDLSKAEEVYVRMIEDKDVLFQVHGRSGLYALYLLQGKLKKAKDQAEGGIEPAKELEDKIWESTLHLDLAYCYFSSRNFKKSLEECSKAWGIALDSDKYFRRRISILHLKGLNYLQLRSINEAKKAVDEFEVLIQEYQRAERFCLHLKGLIELERKNYSKAVLFLEKAISLLLSQLYESPREAHVENALFINSLSAAYFNSGDFDKAQEQYEKIISLTYGRHYYGDIYTRSVYMLGKILEQKGRKGKAKEHYEKFLDLWKNADPGIPELTDAKKRLVALLNQP